MANVFNPLPWVKDLEIHQILFVTDWPRWKLDKLKALWDERNPAHELVFGGYGKKNFTGYIKWQER